MKTIKLLITILLFSPLFIACEADSVENEDVSLEIIETFGDEDDDPDVPRVETNGSEDDDQDVAREGSGN